MHTWHVGTRPGELLGKTLLYWDNGKENGNYDNGLYGDYKVYIGVILGCWKQMETTIYVINS